jgi:hypothetical protein
MSVSTFPGFLRKLLEGGLEYFGLYYGIYRAQVIDNSDKGDMGRLKIRCEAIHGEAVCEVWAWPISTYGTKLGGLWSLPDKGDSVYVVFDHGRPDQPLWIGGWWGSRELTDDMKPGMVVLSTPEKLKIVFDRIHKTILLEQSTGKSIFLSESACIIKHDGAVEVHSQTATVNSSGDIGVKSAGACSIEGTEKISLSTSGDLTIAATGSIFMNADDSIRLTANKSISMNSIDLAIATATYCNIESTSMKITMNKDFRMVSPIIKMAGTGVVYGEWHCSITSATHVHSGTAPYVPDSSAEGYLV